jgi:DNA modification methylase
MPTPLHKAARVRPKGPAKAATAHLFDGVPEPPNKRMNRLYYGDNLTIMQGMANQSVDLIYLDPPFNSQRTYNLIYTKLTGLPLPEQEEAFCDAWQMDAEKEQMARDMPIKLAEYGVADDVVQFWKAWINALRTTQPRLLAYLVYMTYRLFEMRRILKSTGSIYLHCDPAASHYIKVMMDGVFGHGNFRSEIIWKRTSAHSSSKKYGPVHDVLLFYTKSDTYTWNKIFQPYDAQYVDAFFTHTDAKGRRWRRTDLTGPGIRHGDSGLPWRGFDPTEGGRHWQPPSYFYEKYTALTGDDLAKYGLMERLDKLDAAGLIHWPKKADGIPQGRRLLEDAKGIPLQDVWTDITPIHSLGAERLGYPTQKPLALLDRIIKASSNKGDVVFDPFCGCGTAVYAASLNQRTWVGCDIAILSVRIVRDVLRARYGLLDGEHYEISGVPLTVEGAKDLFARDKRQFQHWLVELSGGFCNSRQSGDEGIDGRLYFETKNGLRSMVLSVKGGHLSPQYVRELRGTLEADGTELAGFLCLDEPTKGMKNEAAKAGMYEYEGVKYPRMQIRTVQQLLEGHAFETPARVRTFSWERQMRLAI